MERVVENDAVPLVRVAVPNDGFFGSDEVTVTGWLKPLVEILPMLSVTVIVTLNDAPAGDDAGTFTTRI